MLRCLVHKRSLLHHHFSTFYIWRNQGIEREASDFLEITWICVRTGVQARQSHPWNFSCHDFISSSIIFWFLREKNTLFSSQSLHSQTEHGVVMTVTDTSPASHRFRPGNRMECVGKLPFPRPIHSPPGEFFVSSYLGSAWQAAVWGNWQKLHETTLVLLDGAPQTPASWDSTWQRLWLTPPRRPP